MSNGRYELKNASMLDIIGTAYGFEADRILGGPASLGMDRFDITAKLPGETTPDMQKLMLQTLLEDRFGLAVHKETRPIAGYVLTAGNKQALKRAAGNENGRCAQQQAAAMGNGLPVTYNCRNMTMAMFAQRPENAYSLEAAGPRLKKADPAFRTSCKYAPAPPQIARRIADAGVPEHHHAAIRRMVDGECHGPALGAGIG